MRPELVTDPTDEPRRSPRRGSSGLPTSPATSRAPVFGRATTAPVFFPPTRAFGNGTDCASAARRSSMRSDTDTPGWCRRDRPGRAPGCRPSRPGYGAERSG